VKRTKNGLPWRHDRPVRIVIVDDHSLLRAGLAELLEQEADLQVIAQAADADAGLEAIRREHPDVVITDIVLEDRSGLDLVQQVHREDPDVRMLVLSMHDGKLYAERALAAGAMGFVSKEQPAEDVVTAVRHLLLGKVYVPPQIAGRVLSRLARGRLEGSPLESLSPREMEVIELLGRGLGTRDIAERLNLSVKTIDTYREQIKDKLDLDSANELVRYAVTVVLELDSGHAGEMPPDNSNEGDEKPS